MSADPITQGSITRLRHVRERLPTDSALRGRVRNIIDSHGIANKEGGPVAYVDRLLEHIDQLSQLVAALAALGDEPGKRFRQY